MAPPRLARVAAADLDEDEACALLHEHGCLVVTGAVPKEACASARAYVDARLALALAACGSTSTASAPPPGYISDTEKHVDAAAYHFGDVLSPPHRRDLKLPLDPPVRACLRAALRTLGPILANVLTNDAELVELSALVADFGAENQRLHPDTPVTAAGFGRHCCLLTAFVALQDVDCAEMGATQVCPGTHCAEAHAALNAHSRDEEAERGAFARRGVQRADAGAARRRRRAFDGLEVHTPGRRERGCREEKARGAVRELLRAVQRAGGSTYSLLADLRDGARKRISGTEKWCGR